MLKRTTLRAAATLALIALTACATTPQPATLAETMARTPQLSTLSRLMEQSGLADTLRGAGPYTVFAPTDEAFKAVPAETLARLSADKEALRSMLSFHAIAGKVLSADVPNGNVKSVQGANLALARAGTFVTVEDAVVQTADLQSTNGVIHIVDRVLTPPKR